MVNHQGKVLADVQKDMLTLSQSFSDHQAGRITSEDLKAVRVPWGIYEQRSSGLFMVRIRVPAGEIVPSQMRALALASEKFASGRLHLTTRQDIQVHDIPFNNIMPALEMLWESGLVTKGGGGNTLRNITTCPHAGICPHECFDVIKCASALTDFLLEIPSSFQLPRKYKIAFSGCPKDCAGAAVTDLGFIAHNEELEGFAAYVGGGMGSRSRIGDLLEPFVPLTQIHQVAEAVKRVFHQHGDRANRSKTRLRFLIERIGLNEFKRFYLEQLQLVQKSSSTPLSIEIDSPERISSSNAAELDERVFQQKTEDFFAVHVGIFLGEISSDALKRLSDIVEEHGERKLRITQQQNFLFPSIETNQLETVLEKIDALSAAQTAFCNDALIRNMVSCIGSNTCRIGICDSQQTAWKIREALQSHDDISKYKHLKISISGCPNSCGRHLLSDIALSGRMKKVDGQRQYFYTVSTGGHTGENDTRFAQARDDVPAEEIPEYILTLLNEFQ